MSSRAKELLRLDEEIVEMIDMKCRVDHAPAQFRIEHDDPAGPVPIDLVDDGRQRAIVKNKQARFPGGDLRASMLSSAPNLSAE